MCGILAVFYKTQPSCYECIIKQAGYLDRRGPDQSITIENDRGMFAFRRLAINDLSEFGNQPMYHGNIMMMCNGEIYNHKQLEDEYELKCESTSDCEVILRLYEKIGFTEMVNRLDGVYAIVLIDGDKVYIARDPIGVRPLYLGLTEEGWLAVSSIPNCLSFCKSISQFPPGMRAVHEIPTTPSMKNVQIMKSLGKVELQMATKRVSDNGRVKTALINAVQKRLMTDRPVGCLLSGGLDSSIITAILVKLLGSKNVRTYSIGMEGSIDLQYARKVATALGTDHHEVLFTPEEGFAVIPQVIEAIGSYDITTVRASVGMYLVSKYIAENTQDKVIFSGEGSDELFCGYLYFHNAPTPQDAEQDSLRLINELYLYDVLRADRTIGAHGLELRVPFLDLQVLATSLTLPAEEKVPINGLEKRLLRESFRDLLPEEVIMRRKDGFSDGVSSTKKSWYMYIQEFVENEISDDIFDDKKYVSKEAMYYQLLFTKYFSNLPTDLPHWMPRWCNSKDPSGRLMEQFDE